MPIFNRLQIENLEKYIFNSYIHDAKILSFKYDIAEKIINIETLNENFAYKINFIFYNVKFFSLQVDMLTEVLKQFFH